MKTESVLLLATDIKSGYNWLLHVFGREDMRKIPEVSSEEDSSYENDGKHKV